MADTLTTSSSPLCASKIFFTFGIAARHGPHHEAQKSMSVYLPLPTIDEKLTAFPSFVVASKSGKPMPSERLSTRSRLRLRKPTRAVSALALVTSAIHFAMSPSEQVNDL